MNKILRLIPAAVLVVMVQYAVFGYAQTIEEYRLKAAFLYNFSKFAEWPAGAFSGSTSPIVVCVLGDDICFDAIRSLEGKTVEARPLTIRRIKRIEEIEPCHILFVSASEKEHLSEILGPLRERGILTVSDAEDFVKLGGMIGLTESGNKIRFEINLSAARLGGIKISSKLLKLAERVISE